MEKLKLFWISLLLLVSFSSFCQTNHLSVDLTAANENDVAIQGTVLNNVLNRTIGVYGFSDGLDGQGVWGQGRTGVFAQGGDYGVFATGTFRAGYFSGDLEYTGSLIGPVSDIRLKKFVNSHTDYLNLVDQINIIKFTYKYEDYPHLNLSNRTQYGVAAQELVEILPELVYESESYTLYNKSGLDNDADEQLKTVNYMGLVPITIAGVQELHRIVKDQGKQISSLNEQVQFLSKALEELIKDQ